MNRKVIETKKDKIKEWRHKWHISELWIFGSILREDFKPDSDIDFMISLENDAKFSYREFISMCNEMEKILDHPVDIVERRLIEQSPNYILRRHILGTLEKLNVA
jgi:hypothetical protein